MSAVVIAAAVRHCSFTPWRSSCWWPATIVFCKEAQLTRAAVFLAAKVFAVHLSTIEPRRARRPH